MKQKARKDFVASNNIKDDNRMVVIDKIALALVVIGSLNWGSVGIFGFDFVSWIFGDMSAAARVVYILVGLAGIWTISLLFRDETHERVPRIKAE